MKITLDQVTDTEQAQLIEGAMSHIKAQAELFRVSGFDPARQGDVLIRQVQGLPRGIGAGKEFKTNYTLVKGEATGHAHIMHCKDGIFFPSTEANQFILGYLDLKEEGTLTHNEHGFHLYSPGIYEVRGQQQGADFQERVAD